MNTVASTESTESTERSGDQRPAGLVSRALLGLIRAYQYTAPARAPRCRYIPTCSEYGAEAIEKFGPAKGSWLAVKRLGRCHPLGSHGYDPVPDPTPAPDTTPEKSVNV